MAVSRLNQRGINYALNDPCFLSPKEVGTIGFAAVGENVLIDGTARFYGASRIALGSHVRVDAYSVLSAGLGGISIWDHVHIAVYVSLIGAGRIEIKDFGNISGRGLTFFIKGRLFWSAPP